VVAEIQKDSRIHLTQDFQEWDKITFLDGLAWQLRDFALPKTQSGAVYSVSRSHDVQLYQENQTAK
jgi:hypothetical protein